MGTKQERCEQALGHARELFEQALGAWFGSAGAALRVTGYEDLKLFVDATSRSYSLRLKKKGFDEDVPRSQVSEGLLELLRKKLVEEEEALAAGDWEKVMQFLNKSLEADVEKAKEKLREKRGVLERRMARVSSGGGGGAGQDADESLVAQQCNVLRQALEEQQETLGSRVDARKERVQAHIHRNLGYAESALRRAEEVLEGAASLLSKGGGAGAGAGAGGGGAEELEGDERVLLGAGGVMKELDEVAGGPGAETLLMPSAFDPVKVLGHTKHLDLSEQISACASMQLGGAPPYMQAPAPASEPPRPHAPGFDEDERFCVQKAANQPSPEPAATKPSSSAETTEVGAAAPEGGAHTPTPTALPQEGGHREASQSGQEEAPAASEATWVPKFEVAFGDTPAESSPATPAVLPHLPPPPNSRRGRDGPSEGHGDLIDFSDPEAGGAVVGVGEEGSASEGMDDLEKAVDLLGMDADGFGTLDVDGILEKVGDAFF